MSAPGETITISVDVTGLDETSSVSATSIQQESIISTAVITGPQGDIGPIGPTGAAGVGLPLGGTAGQVLLKEGSADFDYSWDNFPPALVTNTFVVDSEAEMLALTADQGDVAVRTDLPANFILRGTDATDLGDWQELSGGVGNVNSVNGHTGIVTLTKSDLSLDNVDNTSDANKPVSTAQQAAIDAKVADTITNGVTTVAPSENAVFDALALKADDSLAVHKSGTETITGAKTFSNTIAGSISGNASTVTTNADLNGDVTSSGNTTTLANTPAVQAVVQTNRLDQMAAPTSSVSMNSQLLTGLADPVSDQDAVTKAYVNALSLGLFIKIPVRVASTANVTIAAPGAAIDSVTLTSGDRVLLKDQSLARDNGIYIFNGAASTLTRSTDADTSAEVKAGTYTFVTEGTVNADTSWVLTTDNPIVLGTTALTFTNFGSSTVPDATATIKGKIKLAGDLGGTSALPLIKRTKRFIIAPFGDTRPADYTCAGASNNHIEINNAIIAANALTRGATIELLDGYFELGAAVMRLPNVHIYGQGVGHTKVGVVAGGNFTMFDMDKVTYDSSNPLENSIIAEMEISGENMASSSEKKAINGGNFKDCKIFRIWAHDTTATGIGDDDFYGTTIDQCLVTDCGYENKRIISAASWSSNVFTFQTSTAHGYSAYVAASGLLTASGTVSDTETVTIDGVVYTFKTTLTGAAFEVLIGGSVATALANLKSAINLTGTISTDYGTGTTKHPTAGGGTLTSTTLVINANTVGTAGNSIATTETGANLSFGGVTLSGGVTGNKIVVAGMVPALYNGTFNVTTVPDSTHFTISSVTNSSALNLTIDPGTPTTYGSSSDSILGHNGIGIASGALAAEACIVTNSVCIGNQNNNFLIEADNSNGQGNEVFLFSNCVSINAGSCGFRNTGSINAQFNNCYDYGSPIGGQAISTYSSKAITVASWSAGVVTFTTSIAYLFTVGDRVTIAGMVPDAYNGYYTVQSTPTSTTFTVNLAVDPGTAVHFGTSSFEAHPVDGSSFNNCIFSNNLDIGLYLPDSGVTANSPVIKYSYNYGVRLNSCSNSRVQEARIYNNGRQGVSIIMGGGIYTPMDHVKITGHVYNNGQRFANCDGIDVDPSVNSAAIQNLEIDVHAFDDQDTKTQRYGVILRSGGTLTNVHVKGNLYGNLTAPILVQNTSDTIYVTDVIGINPNGKKAMGNISGSTSFDSSIANTFIATLTGNVTAVLPTSAVGGARITMILVQDGTGGRTLTLPANATSGTTLTLSTAASAVDIISFIYDSVAGKWRVSGKSLGNTGVGTLKNLIITTAIGDNITSLALTQNDTTNNPIANLVTNAGTNHAVEIIQNGVLASSKYALFIDSNAVQVNAPLARIRQQNASSTQAALQIDQAGSGAAISIVTGNLSLTGGTNIALSATTGTQIGTATSQKLGFYAATPIVQPGATTDLGTVLSNLGLRAAGTAYPVTTSGLVTLTGGLTLSAGTLALSGVTITNSGTLTLPTSTDTIVGRATTDTLTNKRITRRVSSTASSGTPAPNGDTDDAYEVTALAVNATFAAPTGTPTDSQRLIIRIKDDGTARTLAWNAIYRFSTDLAAPTTTVISKTLYLGFIYNSTDSKWDCLAILNNF